MYLIVCIMMYVYPFVFVAIATLVQLILTTSYIGIINKIGFILQSSIVLSQIGTLRGKYRLQGGRYSG